MIDWEKIAAAAQSRFEDHVRRVPYAPLAGPLKLESLEEAYAVQRALQRLYEENGRGPVAGYKIALSSKAMQDMFGVDQPLGGVIFAPTVHLSPAVVRRRDFIRLGLEFELAVRLGEDLPKSGEPHTADSVRPYVDTCMPAFELIEDRGADYPAVDAMSLVADNCWCAGVVLGDPSAGWKDLDLETTPVTLVYNDEPPQEAVTGAAMGNPLASLAWVANMLAAQDRRLTAGMIVITGSTLTTRFAEAGDEATYTVQGLGSVSVKITD